MTKRKMETSSGLFGVNERGMSNGKEAVAQEAEERVKAIKKIDTVLKNNKKGE